MGRSRKSVSHKSAMLSSIRDRLGRFRGAHVAREMCGAIGSLLICIFYVFLWGLQTFVTLLFTMGPHVLDYFCIRQIGVRRVTYFSWPIATTKYSKKMFMANNSIKGMQNIKFSPTHQDTISTCKLNKSHQRMQLYLYFRLSHRQHK